MSYQITPNPSTLPASPLNNLDSLRAPEEKVCPKCNKSKPLSSFHIRTRTNGHSRPRSHCKQCTSAARTWNRRKDLDQKRQEVLDFAQKLTWLADAAPDEESARELYGAATRLRLRWCKKEESKQEAVLRMLENWSNVGITLNEIAADTGLPRAVVTEILNSFETAGLVNCFTRDGKSNC